MSSLFANLKSATPKVDTSNAAPGARAVYDALAAVGLKPEHMDPAWIAQFVANHDNPGLQGIVGKKYGGGTFSEAAWSKYVLDEILNSPNTRVMMERQAEQEAKNSNLAQALAAALSGAGRGQPTLEARKAMADANYREMAQRLGLYEAGQSRSLNSSNILQSSLAHLFPVQGYQGQRDTLGGIASLLQLLKQPGRTSRRTRPLRVTD